MVTVSTSRNGLLPGISAYTWWVITMAVFVVFFVDLAVFFTIAVVGFAGHTIISATQHPPVLYVMAAVFVLVLAMWVVTGYAFPFRMRRELRAGYSTLPWATLSVDVRDPRDGRILVPAGVGERKRTMKLGALRSAAAATADRPVTPLVDEPVPLRTLDVSGRAGGSPWTRRGLDAFERTVAAAVPDALLIGALRHPLAEALAAEFRPGVRLRYLYLLVVRPTGLQLWQDPRRPSLILEIPRASLVEVLPTQIQNGRLSILGVSIGITDPAGVAAELPFLVQRPRHPLLFMEIDDVFALMNSMRSIWGMPPAE